MIHVSIRNTEMQNVLLWAVTYFNKKEELVDFLENYIRKGVTQDKFEVIRQKLERNIVMENKKIERANNNIPTDSNRQPQELKPVKVTDDEVKSW